MKSHKAKSRPAQVFEKRMAARPRRILLARRVLLGSRIRATG